MLKGGYSLWQDHLHIIVGQELDKPVSLVECFGSE